MTAEVSEKRSGGGDEKIGQREIVKDKNEGNRIEFT